MIKSKNKKFDLLLFIIVLVSLVVGYFPLKIAKDYSEYDLISNEYIICTENRETGCNWARVIESKTDDLLYAVDNEMVVCEGFNFVDKTPLNSPFNLHLSNVYVVYGKQLNKPIEDEFYENVRYTCEQWEILYPIKRQSVIGGILPDNYLCVWDILDKFTGFGWFVFEVLYFSFVIVYIILLLFKYIRWMCRIKNK